MSKILGYIIGTFLVIVAKIIKQSHILFLGYYIQGTGKMRNLPDYTFPIVVKELEYSKHLYKPHTFDNGMLFRTLGKVYAKRDNNIIYIEDVYKFYAVCSDSDTHFSDCECEGKEFATMNIKLFNIPKKLQDKLSKKYGLKSKKINVNKYIMIRASAYSVSMDVNDEYWVNKGKEYNVYSEVPLEPSNCPF